MLAGTLVLPNTKTIIEQFNAIRVTLTELEPLMDDVPKLIDEIFPKDNNEVAELRERAFGGRAAGDCWRVIWRYDEGDHAARYSTGGKGGSRHQFPQSKGLSSPYVFIAQCVQGVAANA